MSQSQMQSPAETPSSQQQPQDQPQASQSQSHSPQDQAGQSSTQAPPSTSAASTQSSSSEFARELAEMAADFRARREAEAARQAKQQQVEASRPDVLFNLPDLLQREHGLTPEEAALAVRNAVFTLYPDDAPPEHRQALWEARQARKEREAAQQRFAQAQQQYRYNLELAARSATEAAFPDSVAFYDGDLGRYARALEKKALAMAEAAERNGQYVDLTVPAVQRELEADLAARLNKTQQKRASRTRPVEPAPANQEATPSQSVASNLHTASSASTPAPRKGRLTREEADREVMAILQRSMAAR